MKKKTSNSMNMVSSYDDQAWRADEDCRTLMEAEKIRRDPKRMKAAQKAAVKKAKELQLTADAAKDLAEGTPDSKEEDAKEGKNAD